jgi:hypothetical protein
MRIRARNLRVLAVKKEDEVPGTYLTELAVQEEERGS